MTAGASHSLDPAVDAGTWIFANRATDLIVESCQLVSRPTVLLPALYCPEVASALEASGKVVKSYDLTSTLAPDIENLVGNCTPDVGVVIHFHPFGLQRPLDRSAIPEDVMLLVDACHALRTSFRLPQLARTGDLTIFSPRKELGWHSGGVATGPWCGRLSNRLPHMDDVAQLWRPGFLARQAEQDERTTLSLRSALGDYLPKGQDGEVLTFLPLKSESRDLLVEQLRSEGMAAWYWQGEICAATGGPATHRLWKELFLVPLPQHSTETGRLLELMLERAIQRWT
jgi:hypothetical protein